MIKGSTEDLWTFWRHSMFFIQSQLFWFFTEPWGRMKLISLPLCRFSIMKWFLLKLILILGSLKNVPFLGLQKLLRCFSSVSVCWLNGSREDRSIHYRTHPVPSVNCHIINIHIFFFSPKSHVSSLNVPRASHLREGVCWLETLTLITNLQCYWLVSMLWRGFLHQERSTLGVFCDPLGLLMLWNVPDCWFGHSNHCSISDRPDGGLLHLEHLIGLEFNVSFE